MIPSGVVKERFGLSKKQLAYLGGLGLVPHPTRVARTGQHGSAYAYPASIFTRMRVIKFLQGHGLTLVQIAEAAKGTPFECLNGGRPG